MSEETTAKPSVPAAVAPKEVSQAGHVAGLDGIRGVAVVAITAYHLGVINGGLLSVSVFFTLSGFLITSILLTNYRTTGSLDLGRFWIRRARRLLPALFLLLGVVLLAAAIGRPTKLGDYGRQALYAVLYLANWATIGRGDNYFTRFSGPGPFDHLWSLAIEEQFYALWPVVLLGLLLLGRRLRGGTNPAESQTPRLTRIGVPVVVVVSLLTIASAYAMAWLYVPNAMNNTRAYEGTDARAAPILVGALTAMFMSLDEVNGGGPRRRWVLEILGSLSLAVVIYVVLKTHEDSPFLYRGGESVVAVATAVVLLAAAHRQTLVGKLLGLTPLRWLGERTYGIYLWHMPIVAFFPLGLWEGRTALRCTIQASVILVLSALSYAWLEDPVRRKGVVATFFKPNPERGGGNGGKMLAARWAGAVLLVGISTLALVGWGKLSPPKPGAGADADALAVAMAIEAPDNHPRDLSTLPASSVVQPATSGSSSGSPSGMPTVPAEPLLVSCNQVIHIGDSTSLGLMSPGYLPNAEDRLDARYRAIGIKTFIPEIRGARAMVEKFKGEPSAWEVANARTGYRGCWVFALGIGDAANLRGNIPVLSQRIDWMMARTWGDPVLWTTTKTLLDSGPYQNDHMKIWNQALTLACARHPNMRVYDWASEVQDDWFLPDKIHPNDPGAKARAAGIANALAVAFPKGRPSPKSCYVRSTP